MGQLPISSSRRVQRISFPLIGLGMIDWFRYGLPTRVPDTLVMGGFGGTDHQSMLVWIPMDTRALLPFDDWLAVRHGPFLASLS
jgi:hypothetical protein